MFGQETERRIKGLEMRLEELNKDKWELKRELWKLQDQIAELGRLCGYEIVHQTEKDIWKLLAKK